MTIYELEEIKLNNFVFYKDSKGNKHKFHIAEIVGYSLTPLGIFNKFKLLPLEKEDSIEYIDIHNHWKYTKEQNNDRIHN